FSTSMLRSPEKTERSPPDARDRAMTEIQTTGTAARAGTQPAPPHQDEHHNRRWLILAVIGLAQLMIVLDVTIVNIALPNAQQALAFSDGDRQWIATAYSPPL